ncbi:hypothetical protein K3181_08660 [Qipengyuania sp. YG27]|uniref:Uncharacterized protein n=1 Tax=Qipengyuania mesophila TaxID=2867246 RepID=A0ABS7JV30_9SPHN|nr:hypothetical protein [Qipengyuania mesophila]MBX7501512.1 hypothetical protein [Qipengyuania mesophila]
MAWREAMTILRAALAYWAAIFALGFALGAMRVLWGAEALGETGFILVEVPVLLAASWFAARWLVRRHAVRSTGAAALMGALAFALLMGAELALATGPGGQTPGAWFAALWRAPHLYGTLGQVAFGLLPVVALRHFP